MEVRIYQNKLGNEEYLTTMAYTVPPIQGDLILIGESPEVVDVYKVKQRLIGLPNSLDECSLFVEPYDWEG